MTVSELIKALRELVLEHPEAAQFDVVDPVYGGDISAVTNHAPGHYVVLEFIEKEKEEEA